MKNFTIAIISAISIVMAVPAQADCLSRIGTKWTKIRKDKTTNAGVVLGGTYVFSMLLPYGFFIYPTYYVVRVLTDNRSGKTFATLFYLMNMREVRVNGRALTQSYKGQRNDEDYVDEHFNTRDGSPTSKHGELLYSIANDYVADLKKSIVKTFDIEANEVTDELLQDAMYKMNASESLCPNGKLVSVRQLKKQFHLTLFELGLPPNPESKRAMKWARSLPKTVEATDAEQAEDAATVEMENSDEK